MESQHSFSFSSPESDAQNTTDIESQEYEMIYVAEKILENVNLMSFANMDFEEVRSIMRIREIARGIVEKNVKEVTDTDVDIAMLFALENMGVEFCRHADGILERLDYEGLEGGMSHTVSHIKEIVSTIVSKRAKLMVSRNDNPIELVDRVDAMTVESKVTLDTNTRNNCIDIWGIHKRLLSEKANIDAKTGNQRDTIGGSFRSGLGYVVQFPQAQEQEGDRVSGSSSLGFGDVQVNEEQYELVGNREAKAFHGVPFTQAEGSQWATIQGSLCFGAGDSQIKEEEDEGETEPKACTDAQFTEAEENPWDTTDRSLCSEVGHVHVKEANVLFINREAEACNLQSIQEDGKNQGITTDGSLCLGVGNAQVQEEEHVSIVDGEVTAWDDVRFPQTVENKWDTRDGTMFLEVRNVQVQEEQYLSVFGGEAEACNGLQFTQAEGKQGNTLDGLPCLGIGNVQVQEENVSVFNEEAEPCNAVQFTQGEGNQGNTRDGSLPLGPGNVQVHEEQRVSLVDGAVEASNDTQAEGILVENVDIVVGSVLSANQDENALREETFNAISEPGVTASIPLSIITWPEDGKLTFDWLKNVMRTLDQASKTLPPSEFKSVVPITVVVELMNVASHIFSKEPNCVEVDCRKEDSRVVVVGDIHGQFHDLLNLFELAGLPSEDQFYVFNGDYVDRGAWSLEVLLVMSAWKVLMPDRVYLLRGNHETKYCTSVYGFEEEVKTKFGDQSDLVYKICLEWFKNLPLASVISNCVFTAHGGLFRSMKVGPLRRSKRKRTEKLKLGSLEDLSKVNRYIIDVAEEDPSVLTDLLWSDPSKKNGLIENRDRGLGLSWGPDCTEMFLRQSKLKLIIRSHQGPDARVDQEDFGDMLCGYSMDHVGETGKLYTLFSAPSYPQFGETKFDNEGAYAVLTAPNFETPSFHSFKGVERPEPVITGSSSASREDSPAWTSSLFDTEALGISNLPSWSVSLADGTKVVQVPRAPSAEGLPLSMPSNLQETQRTAFEYLLELVAGLKLMLSSRA